MKKIITFCRSPGYYVFTRCGTSWLDSCESWGLTNGSKFQEVCKRPASTLVERVVKYRMILYPIPISGKRTERECVEDMEEYSSPVILKLAVRWRTFHTPLGSADGDTCTEGGKNIGLLPLNITKCKQYKKKGKKDRVPQVRVGRTVLLVTSPDLGCSNALLQCTSSFPI